MEGSTDGQSTARAREAREGLVTIGGSPHRFADVTADQARAQAAELRAAGSWGPLQRVVKVSLAWTELAGVLDRERAATVGELDEATIVVWAERVWVLAPEAGMI